MADVAEELDPKVHAEIKALCEKGDAAAENGKHEDAIAAYNEAWQLIPDPKENWEASTWVLGAIGDVSFQGGYYTTAHEALSFVMSCPGGLGNPFLHLRFGEVLFEKGEQDRAADELMRAYMGAGAEIFAQEDPKYLAFLKTRAQL